MANSLLLVGTLLILLGFAIVFLTIVLSFLRLMRRGERKEAESEKHGGAVIMIGPIPLVLASDPKTAKVLIILAIVLTLVLLILTAITYGVIRLG